MHMAIAPMLALACYCALMGYPIGAGAGGGGGAAVDVDAVVGVDGGHATRVVSREEIRGDYLRWVERVGQRVAERAAAKSQEKADLFYASKMAVGRVITVSNSGPAQFKSVQAAVNSVPNGNTARVVIQVAAGVYTEKVKIPKKKPFITLLGMTEGQEETIIVWNDNAKSAGSTFKSATFSIRADGFIARNITFINNAPHPHSGSRDMQAVAFHISGDKGSIYNCKFIGKQDTLYDHKGRHYFRDCYIEGTVDFIFGYGLSLYESCRLHAVAQAYGSFTAQRRRSSKEESGFSFVRCTLTGSGAILYLGRAWGPYSRVVFIESYIDAQISPAGWSNWGVIARESTVFYGEYMCQGPGANMKGRVVWSLQLSAAQAAPFMSLTFIDGQEWISP